MATFCWHGFVRCISNRRDEPDRARYRTRSQVETIKFENLLTLEEREKASRIPAVTETEAQYIREGRLDMIAEEQLRRDMEMDEKLRQEEERLKREEDAYYAAKREAAKKTKRIIQPHPIGGGGGKGLVTSQPRSSTGGTTKLSITLEDDDEDFDIFLKNVQSKAAAKSNSLAATAIANGDSPQTPPRSLHSITSDNESSEEEEIDFGFWEKASVPKKAENQTGGTHSDGGGGLRTGSSVGGVGGGNLKEIDLDLL